jgi:hypothetical protein
VGSPFKGPEQDLLKPMIDTTKENLEEDVFEDTKLILQGESPCRVYVPRSIYISI